MLAHEIGHWKKKHIMKQLIAIEAAAGLFLFIAYLLLSWPPLYGAFGFPQGKSSSSGSFWSASCCGPFSSFSRPPDPPFPADMK